MINSLCQSSFLQGRIIFAEISFSDIIIATVRYIVNEKGVKSHYNKQHTIEQCLIQPGPKSK